MLLLSVILHGLLGLVAGSFLNVVILRHGTGMGLAGRSACASCTHALSPVELIPVFSWMILNGRCKICGSRISVQYPLVEALTALLFAGVASLALPIAEHVLALAIVSLLIAIAVYDILHTVIPDSWALLLFALGLIYVLTTAPAVGVLNFILLNVGWALLTALPLAALWFISGGRWIGLGDAKLMAGLALFLGPLPAMQALLGGFIIGSIVSVFILLPFASYAEFIRKVMHRGALRVSRRRFTMKSEVAFGPFLIASALLVWFAYALGYGIPIFIL